MTIGPAEPGAPDQQAVIIRVRDHGSTVSADQRPAAFEPFTQLGSRGRRRLGGHSMALPIAAQLARLLGGELKLLGAGGAGLDDSAANGNTLALTLPL